MVLYLWRIITNAFSCIKLQCTVFIVFYHGLYRKNLCTKQSEDDFPLSRGLYSRLGPSSRNVWCSFYSNLKEI